MGKFGIAGAGLTALVSALYYVLVTLTPISAAASLTIATILASIAGFFVHSSFSFRGAGERDRLQLRFFRFTITNTVCYLLNLALVVLLLDIAGLPRWTPIIGFSLVTPLLSFALNRRWVFK